MSDYFKLFPTTTYDNRLVTDITRRPRIVEQLATDPYAILPYVVKEGERPEDVAYYYYGDQNKVWMVYLANNIVDPYIQWPLDDQNLYYTLLKKYEISGLSFTSSNVNIDANTITLTSHTLKTTDPITFTAGSVSPSPLVSGTTYYAIFVDENTIKLASSASNAINGTAINLTSVGDGSFTRDMTVFFNSTQITSNIVHAVNNTDSNLKITYDTYQYGGVVTSEWTVVRTYEYEIQQNENKRHIFLINRNYAQQLQKDLKKVINE
jgi:hypothetical protein